jgi:hypothetical protein
MPEQWDRLRARSWADCFQLAALALILPLIDMSLRSLGFIQTRTWIERLSPVRHPRVAAGRDLASAHALAELAAIAGRNGPVQTTCLRQSLALYGWLRWRGLQPKVIIGARKDTDSIEAHAWVEVDGTAIGESGTTHTPFQ